MIHRSDGPPLLEITLLGGFGLRVGGRPVVLARKARALVAHLATTPTQPVTREVMADLLWTDRGPEQARQSLRQTLLELRRAFAAEGIDPIRADKATLHLVPESIVIDTEKLRQLVGSADSAALDEAERLFAGPFLDRFAPVSPGFDEWLAVERAGWAERMLEAMGRLADLRAQAGDTEGGIGLCERMLAIDPLREDNHRRLMLAHVRAGRRADAIRQYHACAALLRRELDVAPSGETEALYQRLRVGNEKPPETVREFRGPEYRGPEPRPTGGPPWIAVLPLRALGPDPVPDYFAAGLVDDIVGMLAALQEVVVISSGSCLMFRDQPTDLRRVRAELGVRYVVSGTIRRAGAHLRTSVELADAENGAVLWAHPYNTVDLEIFAAQDSIARQVVATLVPRLHQAEMRRIQGKPPESMTAYDLVLQARDLTYQLEPTSFDRAGSLLQRAIALDPNYAASHTASAQWYSLRLGQGWSRDPDADARALEAAARTAVTRDIGSARALALLGHNRTILNRDYAEAINLLDRAEEAAPNDAESLMWSSPTFAYIGDAPEAIRRAERAMTLSPNDPFAFRFQHFLCIAHYSANDYETAAHWGLRSLNENPNYTSNLRFTAASLAALGRTDEARPLVERVLDLQPDFHVIPMVSRQAFRDAGTRQQYGQRLIEAGLPP